MENRNNNLGHELRSQGLDMSPEFSESLHQRTLAALRRSELRRTTRSHRPLLARLGTAAAIAAAIALGITLWQTRPQPPVRPLPPVALTIPAPTEIVRNSAEPLRQAVPDIDAPHLTDLEQDARDVASYLAKQFPSAQPAPTREQEQRL